MIEEGKCTVNLPIRYKGELGVIPAALDYLAEVFIRPRKLCGRPAAYCFRTNRAGFNLEEFRYFCVGHKTKRAPWGAIHVTDEVRWQ